MSFKIIDSNINAGLFKKGIAVSDQSVGTIKIKNTGLIPLVLNRGLEIANLNGVSFSMKKKVTVRSFSTIDAAIAANGKPVNSGFNFNPLIAIDNVENPYGIGISFNVSNAGCEKHIAIVVDESASISVSEAAQIEAELWRLISSQELNDTTLSLIGMSHSDSDLRPDYHELGHHFGTTNFLEGFDDFLIDLVNRSSHSQSDFWASGLEVANNLTVTPDIIIVIADGLQVNNSSILKNLYDTLSYKSHIFVFGVSAGNNGLEELVTPLSYYLGRTPILKTSDNTILTSDYIGLSDFSLFESEGENSYLASVIDNAHVGCNANVVIAENNLVYPVLNMGTPVNQDAGNLVLKNKSRKDLQLTAGTIIHSTAAIDGLVFKLKNTVVIPANSQLAAAIKVEGTPLSNGSFSQPIVLEKVNNLNGFTIGFTVGRELVVISDKTSLQSPSLQFLTAGSKGNDSTKGIHLRWIFAGELGNKHFPKGDLYKGTRFGFNKEDDYVKVYRSPYNNFTKVKTILNLNNIPNLVDDSNACWIYKLPGNRALYVNFEKERYQSIAIIPQDNPAAFIQAYGNHVIEIENKKELFFAAELSFSSVNSSSVLNLEGLSVAENTVLASKIVAYRKKYKSSDVNNARVVVESGRSIRFKAKNCTVNEIRLEFYSDFIVNANELGSWVSKGNYGLSLNDTQVFEQLEPKFNCVHGKWLKYNDGEYVNTDNYRDRWNGKTAIDEKNIKQVVQRYLELSNDPSSDNPTGIDFDVFKDTPPPVLPPTSPQEEEEEEEGAEETGGEEGETGGEEGSEDPVGYSNLDLLNLGANDYHVARMLGLGLLDIENTVLSGEFIYLTEYTTFGDLDDGLGSREVHHISMSLPSSIQNERFPLPVNLSKVLPGISVDSEGKQTGSGTDENGYSFEGKKRYVSLFMEKIMTYDYSTPFFHSSLEFDESTFTLPVYAGIDFKIETDSAWRKPEISIDENYYNVTKDLVKASYEPLPIIIPDVLEDSFFNVRQEITGQHTYTYQGYGINIFSRAASGRQVSILSDIKPGNTLMPPVNINSFLITKENPLMFTSKNEQDYYKHLKDIGAPDDTFIRILFDYYSAQELLKYPITSDLNTEGPENPKSARNPNTIYPDNEEIFADKFNLFFRDSLPEIKTGKIINIPPNIDKSVFSTIEITNSYTIISTGEIINLAINEDNKNRFIGGVLTIGDEKYIISQITVNTSSISVEVTNKEVVDSMLADGNATVDSEQIKDIKIPENRLCSLVENMILPSNWNQPAPIEDFEIAYPMNLREVHREIINVKDGSGDQALILEKTRGIWKTAIISKEIEEVNKLDSQGNYELNEEEKPIKLQKHQGLYKLVFPGFKLPQHPQAEPDALGNTIEWSNGIVRLFTESAVSGGTIPVKSRKDFKVFAAENIGGTGDLVLYISDPDFKLKDDYSYDMDPDYDEIVIGSQEVNYYPGYRAYLLANPANGITAAKIQPRENEDVHYSIFGIRTHGTNDVLDPETNEKINTEVSTLEYDSKISTPSPIYAVKVKQPEVPKQPQGGSYATRPDFFKRSTYTFTTEFKLNHKPYSLLYYRANDEVLLSALYKRETINIIRENLKRLGGNNEAYFGNRWNEFLNFNYLATVQYYGTYPPVNVSADGYPFPLPDNVNLLKSINEFVDWHNRNNGTNLPHFDHLSGLNQVIIPVSAGVQADVPAAYFIEQAVHSAFVPLTEVPIIYDSIKGGDYIPIAKKQTIKDKNGFLLKATDPEFDIAPMMKIKGTAPHSVQFTDFTLDGTSQNIYFYGVREMNIKMEMSQFGPFSEPVKLVPANAPQAPGIKRIIPVFENPVLGIKPAVQIELNSYHPELLIKKINIYRAFSMKNAQSTRTMTLVKEVLITEDTLSADFDSIWTVYDEFEDLESIPFGQGLFYRVTVSREIEYADPGTNDVIIDYTPSQPSKITATIIADNVLPESPVLSYTADVVNESVLSNIVFSWEKTVHNGIYHLYKMNSQGSWEKIHDMESNANTVLLDLDDVESYTDELVIKSDDDERIYHHFKVIAENSSGMYSSQEKILTL